ncbi:MAG: hypothetical protein QXW94_05805, partial [Desulfurococcaceae archaeon]
AVYEFLCVKGCAKEVGGRHVVRVERPGLPTEEELEDLRADIAKGDVKPSTLVAMALARRGRSCNAQPRPISPSRRRSWSTPRRWATQCGTGKPAWCIGLNARKRIRTKGRG